ncbi:MAG: cytochrome P450 [Solirubrobacteraceae bacterium]
MSLIGPEPLPSNPLRALANDWRAERSGRGVDWPPGDTRLHPLRTWQITTDPLHLLLDAYERHGPFFTLRILSSRQAFMIGPEANHHVLVSHAADFRWRDGGFGQLIPLLGDGMLTIDGEFHRRSRKIMLPAFHREQIAATATTMEEEANRAVGDWRDGERLDLAGWARALALRIAMRALFGFRPDHADRSAAHDFEVALGFYGYDYVVQILRGPRTPWARMHAARRRLDALIHAEIDRRRRDGERGLDVLSLLLDATDEDGTGLTDRQIRDQVMTLLFAGHDTTTATITFMFYELARHPEEDERLAGDPDRLERVIDETLRLYPPAWIGPRRTVREVTFNGHTIPAELPAAYSSYVSHRLAHVFADPHAFRPDRMAPEAKAALPRGAYVPFGAGSRICLGMRFGQAEIRIIARRVLRDFRLRVDPGYTLEVRQTPTLGPRRGMPVTVVAR